MVLLVTVTLAAVWAALSYLQWRPVSAQSAASLEGVASFRIEFGVLDTAGRAWDGSAAASGGEIVSLRNWRPRPGDEVSGNSWKLATRKAPNFTRRAWEVEALASPTPMMNTAGLIVDVRGAGARVEFTTPQGAFSVRPADLKAGVPAALLGGAVRAELVPFAERISPQDAECEFSAALGGPNGELWTAWTAYRNDRNEVLARRYDGKSWGAIQRVTEKPGDVHIVKLGRDKQGRVWAVWAAQENANFDLYGRAYDGKSWSAVERLTTAPQPDIFPNMATDSAGNLWVVWQGFRDGKSDVLARRYDGSAWSPEERVSNSPANDWEPAVAADSRGRVYVAWDTYDKGHYDVMLRTFDGGSWSAVTPIADSLKFEAHVNLACDRENRLWAAWSEAGMDWGKDVGFLPRKQGTPLYRARWMGVAVLQNGAWMSTAQDVEEGLPEHLRGYNDVPVLSADGSGRVWLLFRHRLLRIRDTPTDTPAHRAAWEIHATRYDGGQWMTPIPVPFSAGRTDVRYAAAPDSAGGLYAAWPTDHRDYEDFLSGNAGIYAGRLPAAGPGAPPRLNPRVQPELKLFPTHYNEAADLKRIREYTISSGGQTYRIYRGDTHRHTEFSMDGNHDGSLLDTYRYAVDAAELDFLGVSEHNSLSGPDRPYVNFLLQQMADVLMVERRFVPLYAYERSLNFPNGHRNVIFAKRGNPTLPIPVEEQKARVGAKALYDYLKKYGGIAISHTSASNMGTDWRDNDPEVEPLVEIYQGDRVSNEYEGAPKAAHRGNPASAPGGFRPEGYVWNAWKKGYKLGVQASSDHYSTHISYACTLATDLTRDGLLAAMKSRHSYGATDNIILDYRLETGGKEYLQGEIADAPGEVAFTVKILGTAPIRQIDIVRNNTFALTRQPLEQEVSFRYTDRTPLAGESYYYVRVIQVDEQMAWSSPIWIRR